MGLFSVQVSLAAIANGRPEFTEQIDLLVDTGATFTTIPEEVLTRVGAMKLGTISVRLADGRDVVKEHGAAILLVEGRKVGTTVLFGKSGDLSLLGAATLEQAGLAVDPYGRRLVPIQAIQAATTGTPGAAKPQ